MDLVRSIFITNRLTSRERIRILGALLHEEPIYILQLVFNLRNRKYARSTHSLTHALMLIQRGIKICITPGCRGATVALVVFYFTATKYKFDRATQNFV